MKQFRFYLAFGIRIIGFLFEFPSSLFYDLSNIIKNKEDEFTF
jgi:hypothetical protein